MPAARLRKSNCAPEAPEPWEGQGLIWTLERSVVRRVARGTEQRTRLGLGAHLP